MAGGKTGSGAPQVAKAKTAVKKPNPVDKHVGARLRLRRLMAGMSQEKLGDQMGLTFQQIQKYEKGVNRIGASRLWQLARILSVPVQFFYEELTVDETGPGQTQGGFAEPQSENFIVNFLNTREGLELNRAFLAIEDPHVRRAIVELVRSVAGRRADKG